MSLTTPRPDHPEILDDRATDPSVVLRSMGDVARANALLGGTRAVVAELESIACTLPPRPSLLDVGTGLGDIPAAASRALRRRGIALFTVGVDASPALAAEAATRINACVCADASALPFREGAFDVVTCSQLLHHFDRPQATGVVRELSRVARRHVVIGDIRRHPLAAAGLWIASFLLRFHPVSRHDGVASVRRGFTADELTALVRDAVRVTPRLRRRRGFRLSASWRTDAPPSEGLGALPLDRAVTTVDELPVRAPAREMFEIASDVARWPEHLAHYRYVRRRTTDGGEVVEMSANRPFGFVGWPTWWSSRMSVDESRRSIRFHHVAGITKGMDVEWQFHPDTTGTHVRIVHVWNGPRWPLIGRLAARTVIGPVFVHGIASRTLAGLARVAERRTSMETLK